jgi:histidine ammonia-lyase
MTHRVVIDGGPLSIDDVAAVSERRAEVVVDHKVWERMAPAREVVERAVAEDRVVYGVTTGFGALANTHIDPEQAERLQVSLLRSHAAGVGELLPDSVVRAMLLLRARSLAQGYSGVRPVLVERYVDFLREDLLPVVPSRGSVGASGDLAPFAHLALPLIGEGRLQHQGDVQEAGVMLAGHGMAPIKLRAKEGLSLLNGTEGMLALGALASYRARLLGKAADLAAALSIEALLGSARPFRPEIHDLRPHPGQQASAANIRRLLTGSAIVASHRDDFTHAVQDAYSLRCAPQVHGACRGALRYAEGVFGRELGSVVDNPIVLPDTGEVVSGGNFHGQPLALAMDVMAIALTELSSISERRIDRMLDPQHSAGLPAFLSPRPGVNSGYMLAQYTAAALVAESRVLSHPASVESIPTSGSQEDHVSMGWGAGLKLSDVVENAVRVVAVELLCAVQGIEYRRPLEPSPTARGVAGRIRDIVPPLEDDRPISDEIESVANLVRNGELVAIAESIIGELQ